MQHRKDQIEYLKQDLEIESDLRWETLKALGHLLAQNIYLLSVINGFSSRPAIEILKSGGPLIDTIYQQIKDNNFKAVDPMVENRAPNYYLFE